MVKALLFPPIRGLNPYNLAKGGHYILIPVSFQYPTPGKVEKNRTLPGKTIIFHY
jgi:hypothetical protein